MNLVGLDLGETFFVLGLLVRSDWKNYSFVVTAVPSEAVRQPVRKDLVTCFAFREFVVPVKVVVEIGCKRQGSLIACPHEEDPCSEDLVTYLGLPVVLDLAQETLIGPYLATSVDHVEGLA